MSLQFWFLSPIPLSFLHILAGNKGVVVTGKANDMANDAEEKVCIDEECIGFSVGQSDRHVHFLSN